MEDRSVLDAGIVRVVELVTPMNGEAVGGIIDEFRLMARNVLQRLGRLSREDARALVISVSDSGQKDLARCLSVWWESINGEVL